MRYIPVALDANTTAAYLDIKDLDISEDHRKKLEPLLTFSINTYVKLNRPKITGTAVITTDDSWDVTYGAVNKFFNTLSIADRTILGQAIIMMHGEIQQFMIDNEIIELNNLMEILGNQLDAVDLDIDLCVKLREFVVENVPIGIFKGAGKRAQDTAALTFQREEVVDLLTITLLCKALSPIFGTIMKFVSKRIDNKLKEIQCVSIFTKLLSRKYPKLINKLMNYIQHTIKTCSKESMTALANGHDHFRLSYYMYATLLIRQFVNVNLGVRDGNLMTYIIVSVKSAVGTFNSTILKHPTYTRKPMSVKGDDEGNQAQIEVDSMTSKKMCDVPILIACAVPGAIKRHLDIHQVDIDSFTKCHKYYTKHPLVPTIVNKYLNSMFYSQDFGGGRGILMMRGPEYMKITTALQLILFQMDVNYAELAHFMTAVPAITGSLETSMDTSIMTLSTGSSYAYKNCKERFERTAYGARGREWENHISRLTDELKNTKFIYNTAPHIWDCLEQDNLNGKIIKPTKATADALCDFYDFLATELRRGVEIV